MNSMSQSIIFWPLGIKVFNLCIQVNSALSLSDLDLSMSVVTFMYYRGIIYLPPAVNTLLQ